MWVELLNIAVHWNKVAILQEETQQAIFVLYAKEQSMPWDCT